MLFGAPKNLFDPRIHHNLALIAFFAWVGLGSDGLSSSSYGPEEAFLQLGAHRHLALYLVVATVATVFLISASYSQIIELFPSGSGGYLVATKLLGPTPGIISGCALVVDYVLTIAISVASGCDAIFSFLPHPWHLWKVPVEFMVIGGLTGLNMRGVKESVVVLTPIFLAFMLSHVALIGVGIFAHGGDLHLLIGDTVGDTHKAVADFGLWGVIVIFLRAFSLGGGTFTGIEAVSNSTEILREPRVETGQRTMLYMATSLSFTAGGILLCYLLNRVQQQTGMTLNASLWGLLTSGWQVGGMHVGTAVVWFTLIAEGALLFVAAQTGFVAGPRTLASMAVDNWVPKRLAHLSERLVTQNGVIIMGLAAAVVLLYTRGAVAILVVMYSINVFITFTLSQLGMVRHWWNTRAEQHHWRRRLSVAGIGTAVTGLILIVTSVIKFGQGGWVTLIATGVFIGYCFVVRTHYRRVRQLLSSLDEVLTNLPLPEPKNPPELAPDGPTAIVLVESYAGLGIHTLLNIQRLFPRHFKNFVFCSVGLVDSGQFKGAADMQALEDKVAADLERYVQLASRMGYYAEYRFTLGTDLIAELESMCMDLIKEFRRPVVFAGQLVFQRENVFTRSLHHETSFSIQRRLQFTGIQVIILPIRVWERQRSA
ncbi:MAG: APC family permease [Candidatus Eisenbacteria bacterium]|uniref:APC family permease n=1 Tax=Eiseniibacteriota bacterium TaxID=2212470 RepID=A0A538U076_UNCEI|nr:MAG: APC family permease [Candidatus Eisenbacteria bacterium]